MLGQNRPGFGATLFFLVALALFMPGCSEQEDTHGPDKLAPISATEDEVAEARRYKAEPPSVKIKLRKNKDNTYSYELSGDDVDAVIGADKKLRTYTEGAKSVTAEK